MKSFLLILGGTFAFALLGTAQDDTTVRMHASQTDTTISPQSNDSEGLFSRWLDLDALSLSSRYRSQTNTVGYHGFQFGQERSLVDGRVKLDKQGQYSVHFHISSGHSFNWAYSDVIGGTYFGQGFRTNAYLSRNQLIPIYEAFLADPATGATLSTVRGGWAMNVRQLYFSAAPIKEVELQFGSLAISKGFSTEMTSYDEDGYIDGERLRILDPKHLYLDEISATFAYEGDIFEPNFFNRGDRLDQSNYHQFLLAKKFGKRLGLSADYTGDKGTHTLRQGALVKIPETRVLDSFRFEVYERTNDVLVQQLLFKSGSGFGFTGSKTFAKRFRLEGGYADIDEDYGAFIGSRLLAANGFSMNGDSYQTGKRGFGRANLQVTPYLSLFGYVTRLTTPTASLALNKQSLNFGATIDFQNILANNLHWIAPVKAN